MIETAIQGFIVGNVPLVNSRVHYKKAPKGETLPYIALTFMKQPKVYHNEGQAEIQATRCQCSVYANYYGDAKQVAEQVRTALSGYSGMMGAIHVDGAFYLSEIDLHEENTDLYHIACDYMIHYEEV